MGEVGKVTVKVVPDATGFQRAIKDQLNFSSLDKMGRQGGERLGQGVHSGFRNTISRGKHSITGAMRDQARPMAKAAGTMGKRAGESGGKAQYYGWRGQTQRLLGGSAGNRVIQRAAQSHTQTYTQTLSSGLSRHHSNSNLGAAAAFTLPQVGTNALSGFLAMSAQTPFMIKLAGAVAGVGAALYGVTAATRLAGSGFQAYAGFAQYALEQAGQLEQTKVALTTLLHSEGKAQELLGKSIEFAKETPFDIPSITQGVRQLKAYGFATKDLIPLMTDIGDASAALGLGPEGIDRVIRAFGQIKARGTFRADEARQLTEAGIPAWRALSKAMSDVEGKKVGIQEVMKRAEEGSISASFAIRALRSQMQQSFGGGMEKQALTFLGTMEKLKDSANIGLQLGIQPAMENLALTVRKITPALEKFSVATGVGLGAGVEGFADQVADPLAGALETLAPLVRDFAAELGVKFGQVGAQLIGVFQNLAPVIADASTQLLDFAETAAGIVNTLSGLPAVLDSVVPDADTPASFMTDPGKVLSFLQHYATTPNNDIQGSFLHAIGQDADSALAKVKAFGRQVTLAANDAGAEVESIFGDANLADDLERGSISALQKVYDEMKRQPGLASLLGWSDPETFKNEINEATKYITKDQLEGEVPMSIEPIISREKADTQLTKLAAQLANVGKYDDQSIGLDLNLEGLQSLNTALPELRQLQSLGDKELQTVLGVDTKELPAAKAEIEGLIKTLQYTDPLTPEVNTQRMLYDMNQMSSMFDRFQSTAERKDILIGAQIKPADLAQFRPEAINKLLGVSDANLIKLGVAPSSIAKFRGTLKALVAAGAGTTVKVNAQVAKVDKRRIDAVARNILKIPADVELNVKQQQMVADVKKTLGFALGNGTGFTIPDTIPGPKVEEADTSAVTASLETMASEGESHGNNTALGVGQGLTDGINSIVAPAGEEMKTAATQPLSDASAEAAMLGSAIAAGAAGGIMAAAGQVAAAAAQMVSDAMAAARAEAQVQSPSKVTFYYGEMITQGLVDGIVSRKKRVARAGKDVISSLDSVGFGKKTLKPLRGLFGEADLFRRESKKASHKPGEFADLTSSELTAAQNEIDARTRFLEESSWSLEKAQQKLDKLSTKVSDRQAKLDKEIEARENNKKLKKKDRKATDAQKAERKKLKQQERYLEMRGRDLNTEQWLNRKEQKSIDDLQAALERRRAVVDASNSISDIVADTTVDSGSDGIKSMITDLTRQLERGEFPAEVENQAKFAIAILKETLRKAEWKEVFAPLRDAAEIDWNRTTNPASLQRSLAKQTKLFNNMTTGLQNLRDLGLSDEAVKRIAKMDPANAGKFIDKLSRGGASAVSDFNGSVAAFESALTGFDGLTDTWTALGQDAAQGVTAGIVSREDDLRGAAKKMAGILTSEFRSSLGIASPSKVFAGLGGEIPNGIVQGIEQGQMKVDAAVAGLVQVPKSVPSGVKAARAGSDIPSARSGNTINVYPREHMNEVETARMVERELSWRQ